MRFSSIHDTYTFWFILNILYIILWYDYGRCPNFKEIVNVILHDLCTNDILGLPLPIPSRPRQIFIDDVWLWCNFARRMLGGGGPLYKCPSSLFMWCILYITHYLTPLLLIPSLYLQWSTTKTFSKFWPKIKEEDEDLFSCASSFTSFAPVQLVWAPVPFVEELRFIQIRFSGYA